MADPEARTRRLKDGREIRLARHDGVAKRCSCKHQTRCKHGWFFSVMVGGVHHRIAASKVAKLPRGATMGRTEADRYFTAWKADLVDAHHNPRPEPEPLPATVPVRTVGDVLGEYERVFVNVPSRRPDATTDMLWLTKWWRTRLADRPLPDVTAADVRAFIDERHTRKDVKGAKGGRVTSNRLLGRLRHFYNWSIERGYVATSPFQVQPGQPKLRIVKQGIEAGRTRRLRPGEEAKLMEAAPGDLKVIMVALLDTAMRIGELTALTFGDVDLTRGTLTVRPETAKTATGREVPMTARVRAIIEARLTGPNGKPQPPSAFVFGNVVGERVHPDAVRRVWESTCARVGVVDLHLHDLRREGASRLHEVGVALHTVSKWLGHSTVVQTNVYLASTADRLHDAVKMLEAARAAASTKGTKGTTDTPPACTQLAHSPDAPTDDTTGHAPASGEQLRIH